MLWIKAKRRIFKFTLFTQKKIYTHWTISTHIIVGYFLVGLLVGYEKYYKMAIRFKIYTYSKSIFSNNSRIPKYFNYFWIYCLRCVLVDFFSGKQPIVTWVNVCRALAEINKQYECFLSQRVSDLRSRKSRLWKLGEK